MQHGVHVIEAIPAPTPDRDEFWSSIERLCREARFSPLMHEMAQGLIAAQANNEAAARNLLSNDVGRAQTRALFQNLMQQAYKRGYLNPSSRDD